MKLTITHLKAPWPAGAKVGDVVDLPAVPSWAAGKCVPVADDAEALAADAVVANVAPPAVEAEPKPESLLSFGRGKRKAAR